MRNLRESIGLVVIGRNEGERLKRCLQSVFRKDVNKIVYVDSGSIDGSVEYAESIGVDVVQLDMSIPFSAGRARNEGFWHLVNNHKKFGYVQFIDGDCELCEGWLIFAVKYLEKNSSCAVVAGRRKERFPDKSIYNKLCDIEWNTPIGESKACGGDFMIRAEAFKKIEGFNPNVLAGEEPEMCYRLRRKNWSIFRLDHPMTFHDAAILHFSQWYKRNMRMGHSAAHNVSLGISSFDGESYYVKICISILFWAFIFPAFVLIIALSVNIAFLLLTTIYFVQFVRIALHVYKRLGNAKDSFICSFFTIVGKWPQFIGHLLFIKRKLLRKRYAIIEYN